MVDYYNYKPPVVWHVFGFQIERGFVGFAFVICLLILASLWIGIPMKRFDDLANQQFALATRQCLSSGGDALEFSSGTTRYVTGLSKFLHSGDRYVAFSCNRFELTGRKSLALYFFTVRNGVVEFDVRK